MLTRQGDTEGPSILQSGRRQSRKIQVRPVISGFPFRAFFDWKTRNHRSDLDFSSIFDFDVAVILQLCRVGV